MNESRNLVGAATPAREHLKHVEALENEVERLKKQLGDLHCTEVNALRRAYRTLCQHVDALDQESSGMAAELACFETELVTPDVIATELGTASALAVGLSVLHQALKVTPLATAKWVFRSMWAMGGAYVVWRLTAGTLSRVVSLMGRNSERKRQLAAKLAVVEDRIHIMASLLNWSQAGPPTPVPSSQSLEQLSAPNSNSKPAPVAAPGPSSRPHPVSAGAAAAAAALTVERLSGEVAGPGSGGSGSSSGGGRSAVPLPRPPRGPNGQGSPAGSSTLRAAGAPAAVAAAAAASPASSQAASPFASPPRAASTAAALARASGTPATPAGPGLGSAAGSPSGVASPASLQPHAAGSSPGSSGGSNGSKPHSRSGSKSSLPAMEPLMRYAQLGSSPSAKQPSP